MRLPALMEEVDPEFTLHADTQEVPQKACATFFCGVLCFDAGNPLSPGTRTARGRSGNQCAGWIESGLASRLDGKRIVVDRSLSGRPWFALLQCARLRALVVMRKTASWKNWSCPYAVRWAVAKVD